MLLHLPGLSVRQFVMLSIVFNSVLVQSSCHDSSWIFEKAWTHVCDKDPSHRTISLDATYIVPLKNHRAIPWVSHLDNQVYPSGNGNLAAAFFDPIVMCTVSYVVIDFNQSIPKNFASATPCSPTRTFPMGQPTGPPTRNERIQRIRPRFQRPHSTAHHHHSRSLPPPQPQPWWWRRLALLIWLVAVQAGHRCTVAQPQHQKAFQGLTSQLDPLQPMQACKHHIHPAPLSIMAEWRGLEPSLAPT